MLGNFLAARVGKARATGTWQNQGLESRTVCAMQGGGLARPQRRYGIKFNRNRTAAEAMSSSHWPPREQGGRRFFCRGAISGSGRESLVMDSNLALRVIVLILPR